VNYRQDSEQVLCDWEVSQYVRRYLDELQLRWDMYYAEQEETAILETIRPTQTP
jgi:hypothetical protein